MNASFGREVVVVGNVGIDTNVNAVQLSGGPVEDENLCGLVVFDDLVVGVFHIGVADGDSPDHSWAGPESTLRQLLFVDVEDGLADRGVK